MNETNEITDAEWDAYAAEAQQMCECEQDWNCPLHGGTSRPTWIETRYQDDDPNW